MSKPFVIEGELWLVEQEGGYASSAWDIDGQELELKVIEHFRAKRVRYGDLPEDIPFWKSHVGDVTLGRVRITIEQLAEATA